jgi:anionic cell wall polymer biosynthesis LytR-Cps2A-Psr (LCP) family protein
VSKHGGHRRRGRATPAEPVADAVAEQTLSALPAPPAPPPPLTASVGPLPSPPAAPPGAVSTLAPRTAAPITAAPPVVPRPVPTLVPTGRGQRKAARREERRKHLRKASVGGGVLVAIGAVVAGILVTSGGGSGQPAPAVASAARTQHTVLLSLAPANGQALDSYLLAHDSAGAGQGVVVLVPSNIVTDVAGRGSMPLGGAAALGPEVAGETLSDLISVTVDGNWVLTPEALSALVDHLGGITANIASDILVNGQVVVAKGDGQLLNGAQAAAVASYSAPDEPSVARLTRFQSVLTGIVSKLGTDPATVATVLAGLASGSALGTNTAVVSQVLAGLDADVKGQNVIYTTLPTTVLDTGDQTERLAADGTQVATMVQQYFAKSVPQGRVAGLNRVIVLNGTGALGLGQSARERLTAHGLVFVRSANQPGFGYAHKTSVVLVPDGTPDSIASGRRVAAALGLPASDVETSTVDTTAADVLTILGSDYKP